MTSYRKIFFFMFVSVFMLCGCTIKFRATDVELDTVSNATYELESISIAKD